MIWDHRDWNEFCQDCVCTLNSMDARGTEMQTDAVSRRQPIWSATKVTEDVQDAISIYFHDSMSRGHSHPWAIFEKLLSSRSRDVNIHGLWWFVMVYDYTV